MQDTHVYIKPKTNSYMPSQDSPEAGPLSNNLIYACFLRKDVREGDGGGVESCQYSEYLISINPSNMY